MKKKDANLKVTKEEKEKQDKKKLTSEQKKEMRIFMYKGVFWICIIGFFMIMISIIIYPSTLGDGETTENGLLIFGYTMLGVTFLAINILGYYSGIYKKIYGKFKSKSKNISITNKK
ncbi:MAG: hypothetical protein HPAVJP_1890 [Candidatus Hepatoplasma vulgare]|nr:MAG: hypothetical protein HPAVJP_1890 [Candidatus Hepatoplasma sp.]